MKSLPALVLIVLVRSASVYAAPPTPPPASPAPPTLPLPIKITDPAKADPELFGPATATPRSQRAPVADCTKSQQVITLASTGMSEEIGLAFEQVTESPLSHGIVRNAEVAYNGNRYSRLSSRAPGVIIEMPYDLGAAVRKGDVLAVIDSIDLGVAKADLLQAMEAMSLWQVSHDREQQLLKEGVGTQRAALEAQNRLAESRIALGKSRQALRLLGLNAEQIQSVERDGDTQSLMELRAPFDGLIVDRHGVMGESVTPGTPLLAVADTTTMWAMLDLAEGDVVNVKPDQEITLAVDALKGRGFPGRLTWISTQLDDRTRTIKARAELDNADGLLRANMFGKARIVTHRDENTLTVPKSAVHWEGCCNVVFTLASEDRTKFQTQRVQLGVESGDRIEVLAGLSGGEQIVTKGSFLLKTEILKGSIGAGCCEVGHLEK